MALTQHDADTDLVDLSIRQFLGAWRLMSAACPGVAMATHDDVDLVFSNLPIAFFNVAIVTGRDLTGDRLSGIGQDASAWAAGHVVPWLFVVTNERLADGVDAAGALESIGLVPIMQLTGMLAQQVEPRPRRLDGVVVGVPDDEQALASMVDINAAAYGMDLEASKVVLGKTTFWKQHAPALTVVDGSPASCAAVFAVEGHHYVALVATAPEHQRRGLADAAMRHALEVAAQRFGAMPTVLHATDAGRPVYERMGYETITTHGVFMEKRFLEHPAGA